MKVSNPLSIVVGGIFVFFSALVSIPVIPFLIYSYNEVGVVMPLVAISLILGTLYFLSIYFILKGLEFKRDANEVK